METNTFLFLFKHPQLVDAELLFYSIIEVLLFLKNIILIPSLLMNVLCLTFGARFKQGL